MDARSRSRGNSLEHLAWIFAVKIIAKFFCIWNFYDEKVVSQKVSFGRFCTNRSHMLVRKIFVSKLLWNKLSVSLITGAFTKYVGLNFKPSSIFQTHPDVTIIQNRQLL